MALRILRTIDPLQVNQLIVVLHGAPGVGKTSVAQTAANPITLDFDGGIYRAACRKDSVLIPKWEAVDELAESDVASYSEVVVDTAGRCLDKLSLNIIANDPKLGRGGQLSIQGFGVLKTRFASWLNMLKSWGKDIILIAHSEEKQRGDDIVDRLDIQGGSKAELYKQGDAMGRLYVESGKRMLDFSPSERSFGKNPAELPILEVHHPDDDPQFLAKIIAQTKSRLNELTAAQKEVQEMLLEWKGKVDGASSAASLNKLVAEALKADPKIQGHAKSLIHTAARNKGLEFDTGSKKYIEVKA